MALGYRPQTTQINGWAFAQRQELTGGAAFGGLLHGVILKNGGSFQLEKWVGMSIENVLPDMNGSIKNVLKDAF